jgi:hypothetical protein
MDEDIMKEGNVINYIHVYLETNSTSYIQSLLKLVMQQFLMIKEINEE